MELSSSNIRRFLIFSQKKAFLIFQEMKISHISGNRNTEIIHIFPETKFFYISRSKKPALKKCRTFRVMKISSHELLKRLVFQEKLPWPQKQAKNLL